jgi:hypothetical protein
LKLLQTLFALLGAALNVDAVDEVECMDADDVIGLLMISTEVRGVVAAEDDILDGWRCVMDRMGRGDGCR